MLMNVYDSVLAVKGVGAKSLSLFEKLGIFTVKDLLYYFPYSYKDYSELSHVISISENEYGFFRIVSSEKPRYARLKGSLSKTEFYGTDDGLPVKIVYFNRDYLRHSIYEDTVLYIYGKKQIVRNEIEIIASDIFLKRPYEFEPVYRTTKGLPQSRIKKAIQVALSDTYIKEEYSKEFRSEFSLLGIKDAIDNMHIPKDRSVLLDAKRRITFDEQIRMNYILDKLDISSVSLNTSPMVCYGLIDLFRKKIPFDLTSDQINVMKEIENDLSGKYMMNRLLQGDVGCGKTIVAFYAAFCSLQNGYQTALMAPTEVLANQHYLNALKYFNENEIALITGSTKGKAGIKKRIKDGDVKLIIGTHALLFGVEYRNLGLIITDEQHKFGVKQRSRLSNGEDVHSLILSATPIPRSLALVLYGKSKISVIKELPKGRIPTKTYIVPLFKNADMLEYIRSMLQNGDQAYVVCPVINNNDDLESVETTYDSLKKVFSEYKVEYLHGKMSSEEKSITINKFHEGKISILISTTVIEVGIDVPNANIMCIYNADRFGLSQLHQLRGRIGRGHSKSCCFMVTGNKKAMERLNILSKTDDGFEIAQKDLELRGSGDLYGIRQHGFVFFDTKNIIDNHDLFEETRRILDLMTTTGVYAEEYNYIVSSAEEQYENNYIDIVMN